MNKEILDKIKSEFLLQNKRRNIKVPSGMNFSSEGDSVKINLVSRSVTTNMQKDDGAFEGWALVLKRWGNYQKIIISWDKPEFIDNGHYQRFLFRIKQFSQDFGSWFTIDKDCLKLLEDLRIQPNCKYILNVPHNRSSNISEQKEAALENRFVYGDLKEPLMDITNAISLNKQLPTGVFENKVSKSTSIFTGGKSAIDIWGISDSNDLLIFELKAEKNEKVGIISELYFYICVMQMVRKNIFIHEKCQTKNIHLLDIPKTRSIKAYLLTPSLHPLIDKKVLVLLNDGATSEISYHYIQTNKKHELTLVV